MEPLSNELVLAGAAAAALVGVYLLRHIIAFAFKLIVFVGLVLAGVWVWQHRAELVDAAAPYLRPVADRLGALHLSDVRHLLADLFSDEKPRAADDTGATGLAGVREDPEEPELPGESGVAGAPNAPGPGSSAEPDDRDDLDGPA